MIPAVTAERERRAPWRKNKDGKYRKPLPDAGADPVTREKTGTADDTGKRQHEPLALEQS